MQATPSTLDAVQDYYGSVLKSQNDLRTTACCSLESQPAHIRAILSEIADETVMEPLASLSALSEAALVAPAARGVVRLRGADARAFVHRMSTQHCEALTAGDWLTEWQRTQLTAATAQALSQKKGEREADYLEVFFTAGRARMSGSTSPW